MNIQSYARSAATSLLQNKELHIKYPGFYGLIHKLVMEEELSIPFNSAIQQHFESFAFIHFDGLADVKGKEHMKFSFDMAQFKQSEQMKAYTRQFVADMDKHALKLEKDVEKARQTARELERAYLSDEVLLLL